MKNIWNLSEKFRQLTDEDIVDLAARLRDTLQRMI